MSINPEPIARGLANLIELGVSASFAWFLLKITRRFTDTPPDLLKRLRELSEKQ